MKTKLLLVRALFAATWVAGVMHAATPVQEHGARMTAPHDHDAQRAVAPVVHDHNAHASAALSLNNGKKWTTDQPLRDGMSAIRAAVSARLPAIHRDTLDEAGYAALGEALTVSFGDIFSRCRLGPEADVQLHNLLVPMHAASQRLKDAPERSMRRAAALEIIGALASYPKYFDHPGWRPLAH